MSSRSIPLSGEITDGVHTLTSVFTTRIPTSLAPSTTPATCISWNAPAPIICVASASSSRHCSRPHDEGLAFMVHRMEIDFKAPARMDGHHHRRDAHRKSRWREDDSCAGGTPGRATSDHGKVVIAVVNRNGGRAVFRKIWPDSSLPDFTKP